MPDPRPESPLAAFLLTREWRDRGGSLQLTFWCWTEEGALRVRLRSERDVFFVTRSTSTDAGSRKPVDLTTLDGEPVDAVYFATRRELKQERDRLRERLRPTFEADVKPSDRYLMERFVTAGLAVQGNLRREEGFLAADGPGLRRADVTPSLRWMSFDIETDGAEGPLLSIAAVDVAPDGTERERAFLRRSDAPALAPYVETHDSEAGVLAAFVRFVTETDPDVLVGWSCIEFDLRALERRAQVLGVPLTLGRGGQPARVLSPSRPRQPHVARVPGRAVFDGIALLRTATWSFDSWRLDSVAAELLGRRKKIDHEADPVEEIRRLHREDPAALVEYNLEDCRLVRDIFRRASLLEFAVERARMTGLPLDRQGGAVAAFDHLYLPRLHRRGRVAPDVGASGDAVTSPGGMVLDSVPGLYDHVIVLDFKSLYPSIIRTFLVDPLGLAVGGLNPDTSGTVPGFEGARFSRDDHILPSLIEELWGQRDEAKRRKDGPLSGAIKILMNSFYGVLGTPGCRFFSPLLVSSITRRGHAIIRETRRLIEAGAAGDGGAFPVIYGDTDSLFVHVGRADASAVGASLVRGLNRWWAEQLSEELQLVSALELELEAHYTRFFMPTVRGSEVGSKKRYAGVVLGPSGQEPTLVFKGLETVRTDWSPLARRFQRELFRRIFHGESYEPWIREVRERLLAGKLDEELVYQKRLRRDLEDYSRNIPPHVAAARLLGRSNLREVRYVMTVAGPQPIERQTSPPDYHHYLERQLAPAADVILYAIGTSFAEIAGTQMSLF